MKYKTLDQIHDKAMQDPEYREAYETEVARERLQEILYLNS